MKILCPRAYYDPEQTAGSHLMQDLEECFTQKHSIEYIVSTPTRGVSDEVREQYKHKLTEEKRDGKVLVRRFPMFREAKSPLQRALRYLFCNIAQVYYGGRENNIDVIYSGSTPPTIGVTCVKISKRLSRKQKKKVPIVYKLDDIFPDSLVQAGITYEGSLVWKIGRVIENYIYSNVGTIIVNNEGMRKNLLNKNVPESKIKVVNNWIDFSTVKPINKDKNMLFEELDIPRDKYIVLYAGNVGEAQGAEIIIDVAGKLQHEEGIRFVVFGGGTKYQAFRDKAKEFSNMQVFNLMPLERVAEVYSLADIALVTCKPGFGSIGLPSKTWSIMACNKSIIASYDLDSDLASAIEKCNAGMTVEPGDSNALARSILKSYKNKQPNENIREQAMAIASKEMCTNEFLRIIEAAVE